MQAALRALPSLGQLSSSAYELLPATPKDSPLLPGHDDQQRRPATAAAAARTRRFRAAVLGLPAALLVCVLFVTLAPSSTRQTALVAADAPDAVAPLPYEDAGDSVLLEPEQAGVDHSAEVVRGHPRFQLSPAPLRPPSQPVPYPAPPASCLLHLWTLAQPSNFDPAQCDLSASLERVDSAILFVNGTGDLFSAAYDAALDDVNAAGGGVRPARRHYSNMGELRFALRSVSRNLVGDRLGAGWVHGVGSDYASPDGDETARFGQIPHWLDWNLVDRSWAAAEPEEPAEELASEEPDPYRGAVSKAAVERRAQGKTLSWCFHSEIFHGEEEWRAEALPTFNSFAIESQLANVPELSPTFVSMNDDFMILRPLSASDFHTSLFGPVLKVQDDLKVTGKATAKVGDSGEWGGLEWAAWILNHRHPSQGLEYLNHLPKTLTQPHLHELSLTFKDALHDSSLRRFREQKTRGPDIEIAFLATHYIRQRFREALIFSYVVARPATASGSTWGRREKEELRALGVDGWQGKVGDQPEGRMRWSSTAVQEALEVGGEEAPLGTSYRYTSASGLPRNPFAAGGDAMLNLGVCLGSWWTDGDDATVEATEIFRRLAFENIHAQCGGLLMTAILNLSPEPGLAALLPRPGTYFEPARAAEATPDRPHIYDVPHLPLTPTWQEANFSLASLLPAWDGLPAEGVDLQTWTVDLLGRYRYSLGSTPSHFTSIRSTASLGQLDTFLNSNPDLALLALNDDIPEGYADNRRLEIKHQLRDWGNRRWPGQEAWETEAP